MMISTIGLSTPTARCDPAPGLADRPRDAIVVLGSSTNPNSPIMQARVARAVELWHRGVAPHLVMSGRCSFRLHEPPPRSEAAVMAEYAVSFGVPSHHIVLEEESGDTLGNAYFSKVRVLEPHQWLDIVLVTSETHALRARWLFEKVLGPEYRLDVVSVDTAPTARDRRRELATNGRLLTQTQRRLSGIIDGDHHVIRPFVPTPPRAPQQLEAVTAAG